MITKKRLRKLVETSRLECWIILKRNDRRQWEISLRGSWENIRGIPLLLHTFNRMPFEDAADKEKVENLVNKCQRWLDDIREKLSKEAAMKDSKLT